MIKTTSNSSKINNDKVDYVLVLGHQLKNNEANDVLIYRLKKTLEYLTKNPNAKIVLSGGVTKNNTISEASYMKEYLIKNGINPDSIILEDKSVDTVENIENCLNYIDKNSNVTLITSNYHILRSKMICHLLGLKVKGIGCYTPIKDLLKHIPIEIVFIFIHYFRVKQNKNI